MKMPNRRPWLFVLLTVLILLAGGMAVGMAARLVVVPQAQRPVDSRQGVSVPSSSRRTRTSSTAPRSTSGSSSMVRKMRSAPARATRRKLPCWVSWLMGMADWRTKTR